MKSFKRQCLHYTEWTNELKQLHREDGPAIEYADGVKEWWLNGQRHRIDGPAVEYANGNKYWFLNGKRHREDGPAVECTDGDKEWWLNGKKMNCQSQEQFDKLMKLKAFW